MRRALLEPLPHKKKFRLHSSFPVVLLTHLPLIQNSSSSKESRRETVFASNTLIQIVTTYHQWLRYFEDIVGSLRSEEICRSDDGEKFNCGSENHLKDLEEIKSTVLAHILLWTAVVRLESRGCPPSRIFSIAIQRTIWDLQLFM
jgi:hypothetical protein